jgi:hypothetical protein
MATPSQLNGIDFVAYDRDGRVVLLAETKSRHGTSEDWAARLRRNMLAHGVLPWSKYFLIATPERMYLWKQAGRQEGNQEHPDNSQTSPEFTIDAAQVFQPYFEKFHQEPSKIGPEAFNLLVLTWLTDIARSREQSSKQDPSLKGLSELKGLLREARIETSA